LRRRALVCDKCTNSYAGMLDDRCNSCQHLGFATVTWFRLRGTEECCFIPGPRGRRLAQLPASMHCYTEWQFYRALTWCGTPRHAFLVGDRPRA
jgi:hypothetical protein